MLNSPKTDPLEDGLTERTSSMLDHVASKTKEGESDR